MTVMLTRYIEDADYGQHDQCDANLALPKRWFRSASVVRVIHDNSLGSMTIESA